METHSVAIVDDHSLFAQSLESLINAFKDFTVRYVANNGQELIDKLQFSKVHPDIILLDINMPTLNGLKTMSWIQENMPDLKVLALSLDDNEETIIKMLRYGAKGYLLKDIHPKELKMALNEVIEKGYYHTDRVSNSLVNLLKNKNNENDISLNEREQAFLKLACTDKTYKEIADVMFVSPKTVDGYRDNLFKKCGVSNRIGLVLYAIRNNLIEIE